jgi:hypothetical protein
MIGSAIIASVVEESLVLRIWFINKAQGKPQNLVSLIDSIVGERTGIINGPEPTRYLNLIGSLKGMSGKTLHLRLAFFLPPSPSC